jgi:hypothetical protein
MRNEIRQGNYVSITPFKNENDIIQLNEEEIERLYIFKNWDRIKPIPLTEELYRKIEKQLIIKGFSYGFEKGKLTLYLSDEWEFESEFLHQLQNLYFALTNEELTIKL